MAGFCLLWSYLTRTVSTLENSGHDYLVLSSVFLHTCSHTYFVLYPIFSNSLSQKISTKKSATTFHEYEATCRQQFFHLKFTLFMLSECLLHMSSSISLCSLPCASRFCSGVTGAMLTEYYFFPLGVKILCSFS